MNVQRSACLGGTTAFLYLTMLNTVRGPDGVALDTHSVRLHGSSACFRSLAGPTIGVTCLRRVDVFAWFR